MKINQQRISFYNSQKRSIFISYRREDSAYQTSSIYASLIQNFSKSIVFKDDESIPDGVRYPCFLDRVLSECSILICVIGKKWLTAQDKIGYRRLDNPSDFVRIEIESALRRCIPIIPVLVDDAQMPRELELPENLRKLVNYNAIPLRSGSDFSTDLDRLVNGIKNNICTRYESSLIEFLSTELLSKILSPKFLLLCLICIVMSLLIISNKNLMFQIIISQYLFKDRQIQTPSKVFKKSSTEYKKYLIEIKNYLTQKKYLAASDITKIAMLNILEKKGSSDLSREDIDHIPCDFLKEADLVWQKNSNNKYSFSVQKKIYKKTGNIINGKFNELSYEKFADLVGYRKKGEFIDKQHLIDNDSAPEGHFPGTAFWGEDSKGRTGYIAFHIEKSCGM